MTRRFFTLTFALLFMLLPLVLALSERKWSEKLEQERMIDEIQSQANAQLQQMRESANQTVQLQSLMTVFFDRLLQMYQQQRNISSSLVKDWHRRLLWFILPDHDIVVGETSPEGFRVFFDNQGPLGFSGAVARKYLPLLCLGNRISSDSHDFGPLWRAIHFPVLVRDQKDYYHGQFQYFHGVDGSRAFYWRQSALPHSNRQLIVSILIDTRKIDPLFDLKAMVKSHRSRRSGIGFINLEQGRNFLSPFFAAFPTLRQRLLRARPGPRGFPRFERHGNLLLFSLPPTAGKTHQPICAFKLARTQDQMQFSTLRFLILLSLGVIIGTVIVVERMLFHRGPRLNIGMTLLAAFLITAFIPIIGTTVITKQNLLELEKKIRQDSEISLFEQLQAIDDTFRHYLSLMVQDLARLSFEPRLAEDLWQDEHRGAGGNGVTSLASRAAVLLQTPNVRSSNPCRFISISALGPNQFLRAVIHPESPESQLTASETKQLEAMWSQVFSILQRPIVERIAPQQAKQDDSAKPSLDMQDFQFEEVNDSLASLAGSDAYLTFVYYWNRLQTFRSAAGVISMVQFIIPLRGHLRYLVSWLWDEYASCLPFLSQQLAPGGLLYKQRPDNRIFVKMRHQRRVEGSIPPGLSRFPTLEQLGNAAAHIDQPLQARSKTASGPLLLCAIPGQVMNKGVFCGRKVMTEMAPKLAEQERKLYLAMLFAVLLAVLAALVGSQFVTSPLSVILDAIQQINHEEYGARIRFPERGDEFASLGGAFNEMAQGLQEGRILARYVSTSVQEAVSDSSLSERATEGEVTEVTVLFTGIAGFDEFRRTHSPEEVFALLAVNLEAVNAAVSQCGGDIDKVMGEKVLLLFRHDRFLSGHQAMNAALKVIRHVRSSLLARNIQPLFGLNTGTVVAGFVGAQNVRMDYTVIGDPVNLAARLVAVAQTTGGQSIVTSGPSLKLMASDIQSVKLDITRVKGKTQEVEAYQLLL